MTPRFHTNDPWRVLWQIATSSRFLGVLLLMLVVALLLAAWLPQTSAGESDFDIAWQAQIQRRFGGDAWFDALHSPLQASGAFYITDTAWFRLLLALVSVSLFARLIDSIERLWQGRRDGAPPEDLSWVAVKGGMDEIVDTLRKRRLHIAVNDVAQNGEVSNKVLTCADRWPWADVGPVLVYLGGLVVLLGMAVTALWGWEIEPLRLTAGKSVPLENGSDLLLRLDELAQDGQRGNGQLLRQESAPANASDLAIGRPLKGAGSGAYLVKSGPALHIQATGSDSQVLDLVTGPDKEGQKELVLAFSEDEPRYAVGVPEADLVLLLTVSQPMQVGALPKAQVFESGSGQPTLEQDISADTVLKIGDVSFVLTPIPYAEIRVVHDPGAFWLQLGVVCLIVGVVWRGLWPPRRVWLRCQPDGIEAGGDKSILSSLAQRESTTSSESGLPN
jgi:cytochrome c biogenesis protein ResB